ncbi:hypothetical protein [Kaistia terrae]|uniref:Uncharacterized protein n=1 Tax=Kaistia terrae TaxID=537017 RepID=A0ABW0Q343_9HYPH|nr:hypothetical protein [Kaistia terrae]MCX5581498.1 hypothetical protein [Kaistia terrae]
MDLSNAHYVSATGRYTLTITTNEGAPFDYTVGPDDDAVLAVAIRAAVEAQAIPIAAYVEPLALIPARVTSRQFFLQLDADGLLNAVEGWIDQQPLPIQIAFERSSTFVRDDVMLQQGFVGLGFTPQQIDAFFTAAAAL